MDWLYLKLQVLLGDLSIGVIAVIQLLCFSTLTIEKGLNVLVIIVSLILGLLRLADAVETRNRRKREERSRKNG